MPREVIMPALGMAQETGQIIAWLKRPGDAVKAGEPLMEVETDKATMEVEAGADGFLTDVRAAEGASVPIGEVVAMISETDDGGGAPPEPDAEAPESGAAAAPDGHEVIMPALGMAQDSGKIIAWAKAPGDRVAADDVLLEVETDKATMEVQAGHDGWLAETRAADGDEVPVGEVIAIISEAEPAQPRQRGRSESAPKAAKAPAEAAPAAPRTPPPTAAARPAAANVQGEAPPGRILASPKARRLAAERGLDLARLVAAGHAAPFHVADLEALAAIPAAPSATHGASAARIAAEVPAAELDAFCDWGSDERRSLRPGRAVAAFAAAALRPGDGAAGPIHIALAMPGKPDTILADPDLPTSDDGADAAPDLVLRDLIGSRLIEIALGPTRAPTLTLTRTGDTCRLVLDFDTDALHPVAATALVQGVAERIEDPLRHLL